jgi:hypothetical protein
VAERQLEGGIVPQAAGVIAVLVAGGDHQHAKPQYVGHAVHDTFSRPWIDHAASQAVGDAEPLLDLAQRQHATV